MYPRRSVTWMIPSLVWPSGSISMRSESLTRGIWQRIDRHDHHALAENVVVFDVGAHCQRRGLVAAAEKNRRASDPAIAMVAAAVDGSLTAYRRDALVNEAALAQMRAHSTARENRRAARRRDGVSSDNPRCRSLSSITSTASAARSTMELLGAEVNRAPGSDSNGLPGVKAHGQFTEAETATCARRQSHSGPPVPSRPQRQPCRFAGGQQTRRDDNIGAVRPRPHSVVEQSTVFHRVNRH